MTEAVVETKTEEPKLFANKYKTVEDLEEGYKNATREAREKMEIQRKLEEATKVPEDYIIPDEIKLDDSEKADLTIIAKRSGMTQAHFDKYLKQITEKKKSELDAVEKVKAEYGDKLAQVTDFVQKNYPQALHETIINKAMKDKGALEDIMQERDKRLNSSAPGSSFLGSLASKPVSDDEVKAAWAETQKRPGDMKAREKYINMVASRNKK